MCYPILKHAPSQRVTRKINSSHRNSLSHYAGASATFRDLIHHLGNRVNTTFGMPS